eukprot:5198936-Prorocentrum_lima.AAC.1
MIMRGDSEHHLTVSAMAMSWPRERSMAMLAIATVTRAPGASREISSPRFSKNAWGSSSKTLKCNGA